MTNVTILYGFFTVLALAAIVRMLAQGLLFQRKMSKPILSGMIPFYASIQLHKHMGVHSLNLVGIATRAAGLLCLVGTMLHQTYINYVNMTHIYGLLLGYYEPLDYSSLWSFLSFFGVGLLIVGYAVRLFTTKRFSKYFGASGLLNFIGMLLPGIYYLVLAFSKKHTYLLNKSTSNMSSEEYQLYCSLIDE